MIKVVNITKRFGDITAVDDLSFEIQKGDIRDCRARRSGEEACTAPHNVRHPDA